MKQIIFFCIRLIFLFCQKSIYFEIGSTKQKGGQKVQFASLTYHFIVTYSTVVENVGTLLLSNIFVMKTVDKELCNA